MQTNFVSTFIVFSILGALDAGYLFFKHRSSRPLICPVNHDCAVVTESRWSKTFGVRNDALGVFYYLGMLALVLGAIFMPSLGKGILWIIKVGSVIGLLFSLFLTYVQIVKIRDY
ncbi:MAG TPA: vitamin K epoxide reductase family protein, partial [Candidatus Paceibacterota bacterium]